MLKKVYYCSANKQNYFMSILSKDRIKKLILPHLSVGKRGLSISEKKRVGILSAILYRLKTGCQWRELPTERFFEEKYSYQSVFYHFKRWCEDGSWERLWVYLLKHYKKYLDMSSIQLDGSKTRANRGGQAVGFNHKHSKASTNLVYLCDNQGILIAISEPVSGNHHDMFHFSQHFKQLIVWLEKADISTEGLFLNADAGFDNDICRKACEKYQIETNIDFNKRNTQNNQLCHHFDEVLYQRRFVIERTFAWMDAFKALLIRYEYLAKHWFCFNILAMIVIFSRFIKC